MMGFKERLKEARLKNNMTQEQIAERIGVAKSTFTGYEKGNSEPNMLTVSKIMNVLRVDANFLWQDEMDFPITVSYSEMEFIKQYRILDSDSQKHIDIVLSWEVERANQQTAFEASPAPTRIISYYQKLASAGTGEYLFDNVPTDTMEVPLNKSSEVADFIIGVNGDSMSPTYCDGDKVYVRITNELATGHIGVFTRGNDCFIKELGIDCLKSHNRDYDDISASEDIRLVGEVIGRVIL